MDAQRTTQGIREAILDGESKKAISLLIANPHVLGFDSPFGTWLHVAAKCGNLDVVKYLVEQGMNVNARGGITGGAPVDLAASQGHPRVVKYLLTHGAELDVSEPERNPLFGAIYGGHTAVARLLIDSGIDTAVKYTGPNMKGMDALAFAREWGRTDIATMILQSQSKRQKKPKE